MSRIIPESVGKLRAAESRLIDSGTVKHLGVTPPPNLEKPIPNPPPNLDIPIPTTTTIPPHKIETGTVNLPSTLNKTKPTSKKARSKVRFALDETTISNIAVKHSSKHPGPTPTINSDYNEDSWSSDSEDSDTSNALSTSDDDIDSDATDYAQLEFPKKVLMYKTLPPGEWDRLAQIHDGTNPKCGIDHPHHQSNPFCNLNPKTEMVTSHTMIKEETDPSSLTNTCQELAYYKETTNPEQHIQSSMGPCKIAFEDTIDRFPKIATFNYENAEKDDVYVHIPSDNAGNGHFTLLIDSGADSSLIRADRVKNITEINTDIKHQVTGIFGGQSQTLGLVKITHKYQPRLKFDMHLFRDDKYLSVDGVLGRDLMWNRTICDSIRKFITFFEHGNLREKIATLPLVLPHGVTHYCRTTKATIQPRSVSILTVRISAPDIDVVINQTELMPNVFVGGAIITVKNGIGYIPVSNATTELVKIKSNKRLGFEIYKPEDQLDLLEGDDPQNQPELPKDDTEGVLRIFNVTEMNAVVRAQMLGRFIETDIDLSEDEKLSLKRNFANCPYAFNLEGDRLTHTNKIRHKIPIIPGKAPINTKQYRLPQAHKEEIRKQVEKMLEQGIIAPSVSPWNAPIILVPKKSPDGTRKWRLVVDFRKLNEITISQVFPLPRIDEILDQLGQNKYFTTLDLASGYYQVLLDDNDREKTAFSTDFQHYEFVRLPMGLKSAPFTFQRLMGNILSEVLGSDCFVYLDDIVVHARSLGEHEEKLHRVLQLLQDNNLKVNIEKCQFLKREVVYLGHKCSETGVLPDPKKVECVQTYPPPTNVKELQAFLGLANYYRKFIPHAAQIMLPLTNLLKKKVKFVWDENCQAAMNELKQAIINPPILSYPDFEKPFILTTDASNGALGAILSQGKEGEDLPIYFASRALSDTEKRYSTTEKECLAVVWAVQSFRAYLMGRHFTIFTDHKPLRGLANLKDPTSRLSRLRHKLSEYDYEICYKSGKKNQNADALSRIPYPENLIGIMTRARAKRELENLPLENEQINNTPENPLTPNSSDLELPKPDEVPIEPEPPPTDPREEDQAEILTLRKDIEEVLRAYHSGPLGGHRGFHGTLQTIRRHFKWNGMGKQIKDYVRNCQSCQKNKSTRNLKEPMVITDTPFRPFDKVYLDMVGPLPLTINGNKYILSFQDDFSKYFVCSPMADAEAETAARVFFENIIAKFGVPRILVTDNGTNFTAKMFQETCKLLGIKRLTTTPYHPQANGSLERSHRPLTEFLRCLVNQDGTNWDEFLAHAMFVYNNTTHVTTKQSPNKTLYGFDLEIPTNLQRHPAPLYNIDDFNKRLKFEIQRMNEAVRENHKAAKERAKERYDEKSKHKSFNVGDKVWLKNQTKKNKFATLWEGPFVVKHIPSEVNVTLSIRGKNKNFHNNLVKPYNMTQKNKDLQQ